MARLPRLVVPGQPHHVIQRGTHRQPVFRAREDYERMLMLLKDAARQFEVSVHAFVLMGDHFHLLLTPIAGDSLSRLMQAVGRSYVRYYNDRYQRAGALWEGRFKATVIDSERYLFACMAYIELNPVRAGLVGNPAEYAWSSYTHNTGLQSHPLIREHALFWALGNTPFAREAAYRAIVANGVRREDQASITEATLKGWALMPDNSLIAKESLSRRASPLPRGRPRKVIRP